ncbi:hypothetical protein F5148DRAFT_560294 [Russula earlei]|uniref:Uncharacterized protein n=1 Tax=Russula earlei TaxID=71964 RepID=A0ACC0UNS1_9AGAM|nr:hypothetical protein F5148DRAFT_560294 [Russula earlei]
MRLIHSSLSPDCSHSPDTFHAPQYLPQTRPHRQRLAHRDQARLLAPRIRAPSLTSSRSEQPCSHACMLSSHRAHYQLTCPPMETCQSSSTAPSQAPPRQPTFLKVRIVTWNMHESLPKGDLQELLGHVPIYNAPPEDHVSKGLPQVPHDSEHTYHLVVIAGQECPSLSGIPLGLGAGF